MKRMIFLGLTLAALALPAFADGDRLPPVKHEATMKECSACHMAFQPQLLPARSWETLMGKLDDHFGENAQLDDAVAADITAYLVANAADAGGRKSNILQGIKSSETPLRITETPWWIRKHRGEVSDASFKRAGSKANCIACHRGADKGYYEDD
ncbi:MAG: diheme cytochrome c [Alphaproteobacteria bacterium]|nr:diheme cytochrome c [Alphaproteobacteria bacterium]